jgi:hypothetical protein
VHGLCTSDLEDLNVDGKTILQLTLKKYDVEFVEWIHLAEDRDQWRTLTNTTVNLRVPNKHKTET